MPLAAAAPARRFPHLLCLLAAALAPQRAPAGAEQDQYEEKQLARGVGFSFSFMRR